MIIYYCTAILVAIILENVCIWLHIHTKGFRDLKIKVVTELRPRPQQQHHGHMLLHVHLNVKRDGSSYAWHKMNL